MESFRFIHISDLHFSTWPGFYNRVVGGAFYQKFLGVTQVLAHLLFRRSGSPKDSYPSSYEDYFASEVSHFLLEEMTSASEDNPLDAVLVTGDLATTGRPNDIKVALDFFQGQGQGALTFTSPLTNLLGIGVRWSQKIGQLFKVYSAL